MNYIITLIGILLSGVIATLVTYYLNVTKEHVFFMRKKIEELYLAIERFDRDLSSYFIGAYPLIKGELSWDDFNDLNIKNSEKNDIDASIKVLMLIDIYFRNIKPEFEKYTARRDELNRILSEHKRAYMKGNIGLEFFKPFHEAMNSFDLQSKKLKQVVIAEAQNFAGAARLSPWKLE